MKVEFRPRFDYGRASPTLHQEKSDLIKVTGDSESFSLISQIPLEIDTGIGAHGTVLARGGDKKIVCLTDTAATDISTAVVDRILSENVTYWRKWLSTCPYAGPWSEWVARSALVVRALTYQPTGLMVAAPTTSLPEKIGSTLNWDYRYVWLRDASMVLEAMFHLGRMKDEGGRFLDFLCRRTGSDPANLKIMYDISGRQLDGERIIQELEGYRASAPVRIGNEASNQSQLDVYGEVLLTARRYLEFVGDLPDEDWGSMRVLADYIVDHWEEPDNGIWEERGRPRQYTHSKVMCAVGLQSILAIQKKLGHAGPTDRWNAGLKLITGTIMERAWNKRINSFTKVFDSDELDASLLLMSVYGFLPAEDPRMRSTVDTLIHNLGHKGLMYRFKWTGAEVGQSEGAFAIASIWLAIHFIKLKKLDFAAEYIQALIDSANHLGLFAEEFDPKTGDFLGNFPQLFVHTALIDAIHDFSQASIAE